MGSNAPKVNVCLIGSGGVGTIGSVVLENSGRARVTAVLRSKYKVVSEKGWDIESVDHGTLKGWKPSRIVATVAEAALPSAGTPDDAHNYDYVFVSTKQLPDSYSVAELIRPVVTPGVTAVVLIQNGLDIELPIIEAFPQNTVISGVSVIGSRTVGENGIAHIGSERVIMGPHFHDGLDRETQIRQATDFVAMYDSGGPGIVSLDLDMPKARWYKLLWNGTFNTLCALMKMDVGEVQSSKGRESLLVPMMRELMAIAKEDGVELPEPVIQKLAYGLPDDCPYRPSMLVDVEQGRLMEIEVILGNALKKAESCHTNFIVLPFNTAGDLWGELVGPRPMMSEQHATNMTGNGNVGGDQNQQQGGPEAAVVQKIIGNQANGSHEKDIGGSSQSLGAGSPEVSVAEESHGNLHEQPRKRAKRIVRSMPGSSCLRCKVKKTKCEPSDTKERICKRCESGNHECQYPIQRWAPRSDNLDIGFSDPSSSDPRSAAFENQGAYESSFDARADLQRKDAHIDRLEQTLSHYTALENQRMGGHASNNANVAAYALNPPQHHPTDTIPRGSNEMAYLDVIDHGILDLKTAHGLLQEFQSMNHNFPYIAINPNISTGMLRRDSPMLLLAIYTAAAWKDRGLQIKLERAYLEELARRMVVDGEQTLDMLQGLLVHLSWCHLHLKSSYRLTSLAISLVTTLGINRRPMPADRQNLSVIFPFPKGAPAPSNSAKTWSPDARRAYIGAYVICSSYAHALRKTSTLKYTPYLEECAQSLSSGSGLPSDVVLIHHVRLAHHVESISDTFDYDFSRSLPPVPDSQLSFHVRSFSAALTGIESLIPTRLTGNSLLATSLHVVSAYTHEIGLHGLCPNDPLSLPRTTILIDCLGAVRRVLDAVVALNDVDFRALFGYNWARIHYSLSLAVELSLGISSPSWGVENVRAVLALESYVDVFVQRLEGVSALVRKEGDQGDWFGFLAALWKELRRNYTEGMGSRGVVVPGEIPPVQELEGWLGLEDMDFMPNEWLWMVPAVGM
ncbi:hypothetical protein O988_05343 [Pseudogymnoascus sp. VKM F-3808]|nr:hypothetical protein O988_05343 [Pseudogymnoascus sp. VKM F-3808]